jgi:PTH1 family peptidyl-tRNA hydrolase
MKLIVGLGNPGKKYEKTRHNVGFLVADELASRDLPGVKILKPDTFMNLSGQAVVEAIRQTNMTPADIIVIYDDANLDFGAVRYREGGSAGGHNGMKSIIELLGTSDIPRVRVGIGRSPHEEPLDEYVLGKWTKQEAAQIKDIVQQAADAVEKHL